MACDSNKCHTKFHNNQSEFRIKWETQVQTSLTHMTTSYRKNMKMVRAVMLLTFVQQVLGSHCGHTAIKKKVINPTPKKYGCYLPAVWISMTKFYHATSSLSRHHSDLLHAALTSGQEEHADILVC
jgi:hypothetical protein